MNEEIEVNSAVEELNERLEEYTDDICPWCYAQVTDRGRIHLDGMFDPDDLKELLQLVESY
jgi:hypothetical protein